MHRSAFPIVDSRGDTAPRRPIPGRRIPGGRIPAAHPPLLIFTTGFFGCHATASAWVTTRARTAKSHASVLYLTAYYAGSSIGGTLIGLAWTHGGWTATALSVAACYAAAACCLAGLRDPAGPPGPAGWPGQLGRRPCRFS